MTRGSTIVVSVLAAFIAWGAYQWQRSESAALKAKALCGQFKQGDSTETARAKGNELGFDRNREFALEAPNRKRLVFEQAGISVGPFQEQARCRIDHENGVISEIKFEMVDTTR